MLDFGLVFSIIYVISIVVLSVILGIILGAYVATTAAATAGIKVNPMMQKVLVIMSAASAGYLGLIMGLRWAGIT